MSSINAESDEACISALILCSYQVFTAVLNAAIEINLFDIIAKEEQTHGALISASQISSKMSTQHSELPNRLERMLRLLASHSLLTCATRTDGDGPDGITKRVFGVSPIGKYLVSNESEGNIASSTSVLCSPAFSQVWPHFKDVIIEADDDLFKKVHGMPIYQYTDIDPTLNHIFNKSMYDLSTLDMNSMLQVYTKFEGISTLVDVGGGTGKTMHMIISKYPSIKGINFDLPHVVEKAPTYPGIKHIGGDMFTSVPHGDAIILKAILHNWSDAKCISLLRNCHKALSQNGKVIVLGFIVPDEPNSDVSKIVSMVDNVMFFTIGGKERTTNEFEALSKLSGFSRCEVVCTTSTALGVIEFYK